MRSLPALRSLRILCGFSSLAGLAALVAGCGSTPAAMMTGAATSRFCEYSDFSVDITAGPSAGLRLAGSLILQEELVTGGLSGSLKIADGSRVPVSGSVYKSGDIALTFHTKTGYVMGLGKLGDNFCKAGTTITGVAIGPRVDMNSMIGGSDTGHWLLAGSYNLDPITTTYTLAEPTSPSQITFSSGSNTFSITCQMSATQVSGSCCSGNVGGGGTSTTCVSGNTTCTTTRSNGATTADTCCNGPKPPGSAVPDCASGTSQIQS
jgi:hypothetical protein